LPPQLTHEGQSDIRRGGLRPAAIWASGNRFRNHANIFDGSVIITANPNTTAALQAACVNAACRRRLSMRADSEDFLRLAEDPS
jgi:hypothetical protein